MSIENHPNFHSCKFVCDITRSFYESLRGKVTAQNISDGIQDDIRRLTLKFVEEVERIVDIGAKIEGGKPKGQSHVNKFTGDYDKNMGND